MLPSNNPLFDPKREIAEGAIIGIDKKHPLWQPLYKTIDFMLDCFKSPSNVPTSPPNQPYLTGLENPNDIAGFAQTPADQPSLWATQMALKSMWWVRTSYFWNP